MQDELEQHSGIHADDKTREPEPRGGMFASAETLKRDKNKQENDTVFTCEKEFCRRTFPKASELRHHQKIHSGKKLFICHDCGRPFFRLVDLKRHSTSHTDKRPYGCKLCEKQFKMKQALMKHYRRFHTEERRIAQTKPRITEHSGKTVTSEGECTQTNNKHRDINEEHEEMMIKYINGHVKEEPDGFEDEHEHIIAEEKPFEKETVKRICSDIKEEPFSSDEDEYKEINIKSTDLKEEPNGSDEGGHEQTIVISNVFSLQEPPHGVHPETKAHE